MSVHGTNNDNGKVRNQMPSRQFNCRLLLWVLSLLLLLLLLPPLLPPPFHCQPKMRTLMGDAEPVTAGAGERDVDEEGEEAMGDGDKIFDNDECGK
jgi:hypothetical protein